MAESAEATAPAPEQNVIVERAGALGILRLNRPKALNSLSLDMLRAIDAALDDFAADAAIGLVLIEGAGERGLCAGGDIRALYNGARAGDGTPAVFFREEYALNAKIARFGKPYVAFMDGIVMGGGVGVSAHGRFRVVTERTRLAMPETGIGFLPDVGGTWLLSRAAGHTGTYIGLTGETIEASDAIFAGLADALVPAAELPKLREALASLGPQAVHESVSETLARFAESLQPGLLEKHRHIIDATMHSTRVEDIIQALEQDGSEFAKATAKTIAAKSPTSLKVTLRLLHHARAAPDLETCLIHEFRAGMALLAGHDFREGVRAAVIDKDRNPRWSPPHLHEVEEIAIETLLSPHADEPVFPARETRQ